MRPGVAYSHLIWSANGITAPSPDLRQKLSNFFDLPIEKLFTSEALAVKYHEGQARGGKISRRYGRRAALTRVPDALREAGAEAGRKAPADAGCLSRSKITKQFSAWLSC